jgi:hypothetical protein
MHWSGDVVVRVATAAEVSVGAMAAQQHYIRFVVVSHGCVHAPLHSLHWPSTMAASHVRLPHICTAPGEWAVWGGGGGYVPHVATRRKTARRCALCTTCNMGVPAACSVKRVTRGVTRQLFGKMCIRLHHARRDMHEQHASLKRAAYAPYRARTRVGMRLQAESRRSGASCVRSSNPNPTQRRKTTKKNE